MGAKEFGPCEAPTHVAECNGLGETRDHFTPISIAREFGWNDKQIRNPRNIQHLSVACHKEKDSTTARRLDVLRRQKAGEVFSFEQHAELINSNGNGKQKTKKEKNPEEKINHLTTISMQS